MTIKLSDDQNLILERYMEGILQWNEKVNLTNITDPEEFRVKHTLDSLVCAEYPEFRFAKNVIDVGTGGGFPGVPLAVYAPEKNFVLMDSLKKRLKIIDELTEELGITNVQTLHGRAEDVGRAREHREKYDLCVTRAVSNLATLVEYCLPLVKVGGYLLAYKGPAAEEELKEAAEALKILGGRAVEVRSGEMDKYGLDHRVIVIEKVKPVPKAYPRKAGTPLKAPLGVKGE